MSVKKIFFVYCFIEQSLVINQLYRFVRFFPEKSVHRCRFYQYIFECRCPPLIICHKKDRLTDDVSTRLDSSENNDKNKRNKVSKYLYFKAPNFLNRQ